MRYQHNTPLAEAVYVVTDTETTCSPNGLRAVEIAAVKVLPDFRADFSNAFQTLVNPGCRIDPFSKSIHGITDDMTANAPDEAEAVRTFADFMQEGIFTAHNLPFDYGIIFSAMKRSKIAIPTVYCLDTLKLSKRLYPQLINHKLDTLINFFSLTSARDARHRALYDADVTALLLVKILAELSDKGIRTLGDIFFYLKYPPDTHYQVK
jgi:DNA polymerase-3 subunit epsilon